MIKKKKKKIEINKVEEKDDIKDTLDKLKQNSDVNPDLNEFFDAINEKKKSLENNEEIVEPIDKKTIKKEKKFGSSFKTFICIIALLLSTAYLIIYIKDAFNNINYIQDIINAITLFIILLFIVVALTGGKTIKNIFGSLASLLVIALISLNVLVSKDMITLPTLTVMGNFNNVSLIDAMKWASDNNITLETIYEYSDNVNEGNIITQDILPDTVLKKIKKVVITVSEGPNYEKELIISNMIGMKIDDLLNFINKNHLKNVSINYEISNDVDKDVITYQSNKGQIKRSDNISFKLSLGPKEALVPIKLDDLVNKSEFEVTLYLKKNGISYTVNNDFSDTIKKGYVISQDKKVNTEVTPLTDTINLVISKGKKITIPNFSSKDVDDVIAWITKNNLKVEFTESYDTKIENGSLININYNLGDIISEGTKITINTSKGALTIPKFNSLAEFINWASENGIKYSQKFEFNDSVSKGNIINLSIASGKTIDPATDNIVVTISYGSPVTVPNFAGKSRSVIQSTCNNVKLNCTFYSTGYGNAAQDTATTQSVGAGNRVVSGTYIKIGLSNGPAKTYSIYIAAEWIQSNADSTIQAIRNNLTAECPGVTFNFAKKPHNSVPAGFIHPDSPVQGGNNSFTQGRTYTIWIVE